MLAEETLAFKMFSHFSFRSKELKILYTLVLKMLLAVCRMRMYMLFQITLQLSFRQVPFYMEQRAYVQFRESSM
jgi:hypothetical protein